MGCAGRKGEKVTVKSGGRGKRRCRGKSDINCDCEERDIFRVASAKEGESRVMYSVCERR